MSSKDLPKSFPRFARSLCNVKLATAVMRYAVTEQILVLDMLPWERAFMAPVATLTSGVLPRRGLDLETPFIF